MKLNQKGVAGIAVIGVLWVFMVAGLFMGHAHQAYQDGHSQCVKK